ATLAQIGLATNRDGTLTVNSSVLQQAMSNYPDAIAAIFAPTTANAIGLSSTIQQMSFAAASTTTGLGASTNTYTNAQKDLAD
ncbi:flagellar filament capping protein FliD, partial [Clostridium perfringens]